MRFGEYLIKKEMIDRSELEDALKFQEENHITLGVLAIREQLLSNKQLSTVLDNQRERGGLFGDIAKKKQEIRRERMRIRTNRNKANRKYQEKKMEIESENINERKTKMKVKKRKIRKEQKM